MRIKFRILGLFLLVLCACTMSAQVAEIPTIAVLPSSTPSPTYTATNTLIPTATDTPTITPSPTATWTPNLNTQVAQARLTNEAGEATLTWMASSPTPTPTASTTLTPSQTITNTITPTASPSFTASAEPIQAMLAAMMYVRGPANLRTCPRTSCVSLAHLRENDTVTATGTINGESVNRGNQLWYRVDYNGQQAYIWSGLVSNTLPTPVTPTQTPPRQIIYPTSAPAYVEPTDVPIYPDGAYVIPYPGTGYVVTCRDGAISHSGGRRGACSHHGGVSH